ncbi:Wzz/FepE/Etk N-terminal domain-containing protein [Ralstonia sp.]|uniref:Wzz/FepE/Etk N-terminal domain-containing protein n=1 Tax=Ralstonia sp. TaxID=54061 RepID=UPI00257DB241|nr:Wzz/FepE/Etk N-terminal domain-containing protein [Ralstonia sp.]MBA4281083.1 lipopolysaccharide biosynthesis protein [Ralstonia sp.]
MENIRPDDDSTDGGRGLSIIDLLLPLAAHLKLLLIGPVVAGLLALASTYLITPTFTATTTFLPPQQQQGVAASALASLGALSGLAGVAGGLKSTGDQYVSLMQSVSVSDRLIDSFKLMDVYGVKYRFEARKELAGNVSIALGKKDGLISVSVVDEDPQRAANIANQYVEELRRVTGELALTEAQIRRVFFENQLKDTRSRLASAQEALQSSGFSPGALRAEPKAAAEGYARLKAEVTAAEVRLQTMRRSLADTAPEVQQQQTLLSALRAQVAKMETDLDTPRDSDYVGKYREFKYQETLFELFSRQFELAKLDESREGALIQVVDVATEPEWKSHPKRATAAIAGTALSAILLIFFVLVRNAWRQAAENPATAQKMIALENAVRRR